MATSGVSAPGSPGSRPGGGASSPEKRAATSRAIPYTDRQSGRLRVISISRTSSPSGSTSANGVPGSTGSERTRMPLWSDPSSSSRSERIIPSETSPRSLACSRRLPSGSTAPGSATATVAPAPKFQAPHTIWRGSPSPTSTRQSWSRSAFGCFSASSTRPTRKSPRLPSVSATPRRVIRSTSQVEMTSCPATSGSGTSKSTYSRSQETGTFMSELPQEAQVVVPEEANVGDPVAELGDPLEPEAEREAAPLLGVEPDELEERRVDHAGAAHLDPAGEL